MTQAQGIDCSKWQATTPPLAGLDFLFARASIAALPDGKYAMHIANARKAGLIVGAYHFNNRNVPVATQVSTFLAAAGDVDLYALDVEGANAFDLAQTRAFVKGVQAAGKRCGLYMSDSAFLDAGQDWDWVAKWSTTAPKRPYDIWQWQGSPLDRDRFRGTRAELLTFAGIPLAPDTATETEMYIDDTAKLTYYQVANVKAGRPVTYSGGVHTTPATPTAYPLLGSNATHYNIRLPGDLGGWIAKTDVGSISEPGPIPPLPVPDCTAAVKAAVAVDRATAYVGWKP